jgi:beta-N-acetylhexosaminidase
LVLLSTQSVDGGAAVDGLLDGLAAAQARGDWQASEGSEARRLALLPQTAPLPWDELMTSAVYRRALERLEALP